MDLDSWALYDIDFGKVKFGSVYVKTFTDPHFFKIRQVTQYTDSCCADNRCQVSIDEMDATCLRIKFAPDRPRAFYCSYFKIVNEVDAQYIICTKASTEDLVVSSSRRKIEIKASNRGESKATWLDLHNSSKSGTTFQFQLDRRLSDLSVKPREGFLSPGEKLKIVLTFAPINNGIKYRTLYCFLQHHAPIVTELLTVCDKKGEQKLQTKVYFIEPIPKVDHTFRYVFQSSVKKDFNPADYPQLVNPPIVVNRKYLDLGSKCRSSGDAAATTTFIVTNLSPVDISVRWQSDSSGVFEVDPDNAVMKRVSKNKFTVYFNPTSNDNFFSSVLEGCLHWGANWSYVVPFYMPIQLVGNSFGEGNFGWLGEYKMPSRVVLPPTVPGKRICTTFILKRKGHLPIMFRFSPTHASRYRIEPELGVIEDELQIFLVEFTPGLITGIHKEKWNLILNTSIVVDLEIVASVENPNLWFPNGDKIEFPPTPVNCSLESYVQVKNITRHLLRFNFEISNEDIIRCSGSKDTLLPGEQTRLWLVYNPISLGFYNASRYVSFSCQHIETSKIYSNKHLIHITGSSVLPQLECTPMNLLAPDVHRDEIIKESFVVLNSGECMCFIKLKVIPKEPLSAFRQFTFNPECFTLHPRDVLKVNVTILADTSGYQSFEVLAVICQTRAFKKKEEVCSIHLLNVNFFCHSYRFRIVDIVNLDGDEVAVPKYHLWNILNINRWNEQLKKSSTNFTNEDVAMKVPEYELGQKVLRVSLIFENSSDVPCTLNFIKTTPCDCPPYTTKTGIILQRPDYLCPHRSQIYFDPSSQQFQVKERRGVTISVVYNDSTVTVSSFRLSVFCSSHPSVEHNLNIYLTRNIIGPDEISADVCQHDVCTDTSTMSLEQIFIAVPSPPVQAIWFYNNSSKEVDYSVVVDGEDKEILNCSNPTGKIPQCCLYPLLLKFSPISPTENKVTLECSLGDRKRTVILTGRGVLHHLRNPLLTNCKMPFSSEWTMGTAPVFLTHNHLTIDSMTTHAFTKIIFQLINNHSTVDVSFKWHPYVLTDIVAVTISPETGTLRPGEAITLCLSARSFYQDFNLTLPLTCHLIYDRSSLPTVKLKKSRSTKGTFSLFNQFKDSNCVNSGCERNTNAAIPSYLTVTVSINCTDAGWLDKLPHGLKKSRASWKTPISNGSSVENWDLPPIEISLASDLLRIFSYVILESMESKRFQSILSTRLPSKYYPDIEALAKSDKIAANLTTAPQVLDVIDQALLSTFSQLLQEDRCLKDIN